MDWAGAVVIFDEAHNLEGVASDAASAELSSYDMAAALSELDDCAAIVQVLKVLWYEHARTQGH